MELNNLIKEKIKSHAKKESPNECCGFIIKNKDKIDCVECKNISKNPERSFIGIWEHNPENVIGVYHSHQDNSDFSITDMAISEKIKKIYYLYNLKTDAFYEYIPSGRKVPYEGRIFIPSLSECISLVEDYYKNELNITFKTHLDHPLRYDTNIWNEKTEKEVINKKYKDLPSSQDTLKKYYISNGFIEIGDLKQHDVLILQLPKLERPTHFLIYLGENRVLTYVNRISEIETYRGAYRKMTKHIMRHNSLI